MSTSSGNPQAGNDTPQTFDVRGANTVGDPPDTLDRRYFVHDSNFYQPGRVFSVVWHEGLGDTAANAADLSTQLERLHERSTALDSWYSWPKDLFYHPTHGCRPFQEGILSVHPNQYICRPWSKQVQKFPR